MTVSEQKMQRLAALVSEVPGEFVEIGVFRGESFQWMVREALRHNRKRAHAFDSFFGMMKPRAEDQGQYPEGKLSVGGPNKFHEEMKKRHVEKDFYSIHPGFIPECFNGFGDPIALAFVDVDQYFPTLTALNWVWERLVPGGIIIADDYFRDRGICAARGIDEFLSTRSPLDVHFLECRDTQIVLRNGKGSVPRGTIVD